MKYSINLTPKRVQNILQALKLPNDSQILDITAFGDVFIKLDNTITLYSFTDGTICDVSDLVEEFGLPPANLDLGDQWYQLSAQTMLYESHYTLADDECFSFKHALYEQGIYGPENITIIKLLDYYTQRLSQLTHSKNDH